jgi:hypothetical protein
MSTTTIRVSDDIREGTPLRYLVDRASVWVSDVFADLPTTFTVEWTPLQTNGSGAAAILRLSGKHASDVRSFGPDELNSQPLFRQRLNGLILDVNGEDIKVTLKRLTALTTGGD